MVVVTANPRKEPNFRCGMRALLTIVSGEGTPRSCELDPERPSTVGRSRDNTIVLHDERASRQHAHIYCENGQWFLRDNATLNGTRVGSALIDGPVALHDGQIGRAHV